MPKRIILIVALNQITSYAAPLITFPLLIRAFDIASYGLWIEVNTIINLLVIVGFSGVAQSLNIAVGRFGDDSEKVYINSLYIIGVISVIVFAITFFMAPLINQVFTRQPIGDTIIRIASMMLLTNGLLQLSPHVSRLRQRTTASVIVEIMVSVMRIVAAVFALLTHDLALFATSHVILQTAVVIPLAIVAFQGLHFSLPSLPIIRSLVSDGLNLSVVNQANWLVMYGDRLLLSLLSISSAVAIYSASYQLTLILAALALPVLYVLLPAVTNRWKNGDITGTQQQVRESSRVMQIMVIPGVVGLTLLSDYLLEILGSKEFATGFLLVGMIACGIAVDFIGNNSLQYIFYAQGRSGVLRKTYMQAAALNLLANLAAIPLLGYHGAGIVTVMTFLFIFYRLWSQTQMPFTALFDTNVTWRCLAASAIMAAWVLLTASLNVFNLILAIVGGAVIYCASAVLFKAISPVEVKAVVRSIMSRIQGLNLPVERS
ncbi:MAG: oligosaccharide flippase family protein [Anaerolineae bacterium]|nr:oligosaccharide flippase family protein [Anaerolineae bacterium]